MAKKDGHWYGMDESGVFRFDVLQDKIEYPTTHVSGGVGWILDTHGISALVSQAVESNSQLVVGCGDSIGKAKAAYYLAQKGIDVLMPANRYEYLLLGYTGKGTIIGTAPVHKVNGQTVVGDQPVAFDLDKYFVVEDTQSLWPNQYYDAPARYFRRLASMVSLKVEYYDVKGPNELPAIFSVAKDFETDQIAVKIETPDEAQMLRDWLKQDPKHRAILFHSSLYPYAQGIFTDFPKQTTFGDMRPTFE